MALKDIEKIRLYFESSLGSVSTQQELLELKARTIGPKGSLSALLKSLKDLPEEERKTVGREANNLKRELEEKISQKIREFEKERIDKKLKEEWVDSTLRDSVMDLGLNFGAYHPTATVQREIEDIFVSMGFDILDGPHIEDDWHNFGALNIPPDHPARDMQDTFWFPDEKHLLRTHTSCIQIRGMETKTPPFKFVGPGKVFRAERTDASHEAVFHQLEGMMVDRGISVAHLIYFMKTLLKEIFKKEMNIRLRPGFFPFVEPGFELDIQCLICAGSGCSVCKQTGWVELLPCGMVHPNVLKAGKIDPERFTGFAFGLGLDRLVMMRYGIDDIRLIHSGDLRFISQFKVL